MVFYFQKFNSCNNGIYSEKLMLCTMWSPPKYQIFATIWSPVKYHFLLNYSLSLGKYQIITIMWSFQKISDVYKNMISYERLNVKNDVISSKKWNVLTFKNKTWLSVVSKRLFYIIFFKKTNDLPKMRWKKCRS